MIMEGIQNAIRKIQNEKIRGIISDTLSCNSINGVGLRYLLSSDYNKGIFVEITNIINSESDIWERTSCDYWLLQIAYLIDKGEEKDALELLKRYVEKFKYQDIKYYLIIAKFCKKNGITDREIEKSAQICTYLEENMFLFKNIVKGKTVAVVGNGDSEVGLRKGLEIDKHDLVIRFNNYETCGYENDYGSRTDIWIRGFGGDDLKDYSKDYSYKYVGWTGDYRFIKVFNDVTLKILYRDCCINKIDCSFLDGDLYYDTIEKCGERLPTTGCSTVYTLSKYKEEEGRKLKISDIYGFSFLQENCSFAYHYFNDRDEAETIERTKNHNLNKESEFLKSLFQVKKEKTDKIKIAVCYHKPFNLIENQIFMPIHVGRDVANVKTKDGVICADDFKWLINSMIGDNTGDNISYKNRNYCELTGLYWLWKNQEVYGNPEYIGLFHYRRVLDFDKQYNYYPSNDSIINICNQFDMIVPCEKRAYSNIVGRNIDSIYEHFEIEHDTTSMEILKNCLLREHPEMEYAINKVLYNKQAINWYNIFIARKEIFNEYCEWLFNILSILEKECVDKVYDMENSRLMGFYGEILLAIYVEWLKECRREISIGYIKDRKVDSVHLYNFPYLPYSNNFRKRIKCEIAKRDVNKDFKNLIIFLRFLLKKKIKKYERNIQFIHSLTYRDYYPNGGAGGGGAVLSCQKQLLGGIYNDLELKYSFKEENYYYDTTNNLWDLWAAAEFAIKKATTEKNTIYITHDYGTAFGLAIAGKRYALISHIQGSRVEEKTNFNEPMTKTTKWIINLCEKIAFKKAEYICFPSKGAKEHFINSLYKSRYKLPKDKILYNTLYANVSEEVIHKIPEDHNYMTVLSIGQLTTAKGIDSCVKFLDELLQKEPNKWIRWIIVGDGVLKKKIIEDCIVLRQKYKYFRFSHVSRCNYNQMQYLQRISDLYLMLQRISIFDLSTLEMMNKGKAIVLSNTGGNLEFCKENNIWLVDDENKIEIINKILYTNLAYEGMANKRVFDKYFSKQNFEMNYKNLIDSMCAKNKKQVKKIEKDFYIRLLMHENKVDIIHEIRGKIT